MKHIQTNQLAQRLQAIFLEVLQPANKRFYDEWLWRYYGHLATEAGSRTRVRYVADLCRLARFSPQDKVILDAGCGFGAVSIVFALMGARTVLLGKYMGIVSWNLMWRRAGGLSALLPQTFPNRQSNSWHETLSGW